MTDDEAAHLLRVEIQTIRHLVTHFVFKSYAEDVNGMTFELAEVQELARVGIPGAGIPPRSEAA
jgi:hypothetical protein